jgi:protoporphyrinogen/coproporphyrinogen III oxidase
MSSQPSMRRVLVVGGGVTGLTVAFRLASAGVSVDLCEAAPRFGGSVLTVREDGYVFDGGPDAFVAQKPQVKELAKDLGIADRLIETKPESRGIYFLKGGKLHRLPEGVVLAVPTRFWPLMSSPLFSKLGVARMGLDVLLPRRKADPAADESIAAFLRRRLGQESVELFGEPLLAGIYSGDPNELSLQATFPQLAQLEAKYGSLVKGALAGRAASLAASSTKGPPPSVFLSFRTGMGDLVDALVERARALGASLELDAPVVSLRREAIDGAPKFFATTGDQPRPHAYDHVVVASGAPVAAKLLEPFDPEIGTLLRKIPHVSTAACQLAYRREDVPHPMDASGVLFLRREGRDASALTFLSTKWPGRAPDGVALLRVFFGGYAHPEVRDKSDAELLAAARVELRDVLGVTAEPLVGKAFRWNDCRPQPILGHKERLSRIQERLRDHGGLSLCGGPYDGVGLPDCVRQANEVAAAILR